MEDVKLQYLRTGHVSVSFVMRKVQTLRRLGCFVNLYLAWEVNDRTEKKVLSVQRREIRKVVVPCALKQ